MSYSADHKAKTRDRIIESARRLWKTRGYANVSIRQVMDGAGLTHGGFYAHFKCKDDLLGAAVMDTALLDRYRAMIEDPRTTSMEVFEMVLDMYLSVAHRDDPGAGCPLVALSEDVWHLGDGAMGAYARLVDTATKQLAHVLNGDRARAHMVLSTMVGAITLARGVGDEQQSRKIIDDARAQVLAWVKATA